MTDGVTLLRPAASDSVAWSLRSPVRITAARLENSGSPGSGRDSMAAVYMCIAASARPTITGASPSFGADSPTATRFFVEHVQAWPEHHSDCIGRRNGNASRRRIQLVASAVRARLAEYVRAPRPLGPIRGNLSPPDGGVAPRVTWRSRRHFGGRQGP